MTFNAQEVSTENGNPVELYLFEFGSSSFAFTNGEDTITHNTVDYGPETIGRSAIIAEGDSPNQQLDIEVPSANEFASKFIGVIPGQRVVLEIRQLHRTDGPTPEAVLIFRGYVSTVSFKKNGSTASISARPFMSAGNRPLPRRKYHSLCNWMLYSNQCGILEGTYEEFADVTVVAGLNITTSGLTNVGGADDYWEAGFVQFNDEYRLIKAQSSNVLTLNLEFQTDPTGSNLRFLPGCKGDSVTCNDKFSNILRFGGFPYVPRKNPFEGLS